MEFANMERRQDPRTHAFLPIMVRLEDRDEHTPAQLLDLSLGGAGLLTTALNSPQLGDHIDMEFEVPTNEGAAEARTRCETGVVVSLRTPERDVRRIGVRFLHRPGIDSQFLHPRDVLSDYRKKLNDSPVEMSDRWSFPRGPVTRRTQEAAGALPN